MTLQWLEASRAEKLTPFSLDPSVTPAHYSALSIVFSSLSEFFLFFFRTVKKNKKKQSEKIASVSFIFLPGSTSPSPPPPTTMTDFVHHSATVMLMFLS